jgi:hypothetical protein
MCDNELIIIGDFSGLGAAWRERARQTFLQQQ